MTKGDKLVCTNNSRNFIVGKFYEIYDENVGRSLHNEDYIIYYIYNDNREKHIFNSYNINDYFISPQENRKQKLIKINNKKN